MPASAPTPELLRSLGQLVRGLSVLFWGLPVALVVCVQTARADYLRAFGVVPPLLTTAALVYGLWLLGRFQQQERIWLLALERARILAVLNVGLSPFLFWWGRIPSHPFYGLMAEIMAVSGAGFLFQLNPVLRRLAAMLPDETLRHETKLFTQMNCYLLVLTIGLMLVYFALLHFKTPPLFVGEFVATIERSGHWLVLFLVLLPTAMTMALLWKTKEVIYGSVFGGAA